MAAGIRALGVALRTLVRMVGVALRFFCQMIGLPLRARRRVLRVALVTWVFPLSGTWDTLMVIYPVTWSFMIVAMLVSYFIVRRRCYRSIEPAAA